LAHGLRSATHGSAHDYASSACAGSAEAYKCICRVGPAYCHIVDLEAECIRRDLRNGRLNSLTDRRRPKHNSCSAGAVNGHPRRIVRWHDWARSRAFEYQTPKGDAPKTFTWLARTEWITCAIQKVNSGGETNLHSHAHMDGFWYVLSGRARFYTDHKEVLAELGPNEGVLVPRGVKYWFESASAGPVEILQVECSDVAIKGREQFTDRTNHAPQASVVNNSVYVDG
jgi:mannose-6-phosphate isomerase-like protein (cupin superfamily)